MSSSHETEAGDLQRSLASLETLSRSARWSSLLMSVGVLVVVASSWYSSTRLSPLERSVAKKHEEIALLTQQTSDLKARVREVTTERERQVAALEAQVAELSETENLVFNLLTNVTAGGQIRLIQPDVDWEAVQQTIVKLPVGKRKEALLIALLYAWKDIPLKIGSKKISSGFDSPTYIQRVVESVGVNVPSAPGQRVSESLMTSFQKVGEPKPGDVVFYRGNPGSFGLIIVDVGDAHRTPVGVGLVYGGEPLQVMTLSAINTSVFPMLGYFRPGYPDEEQP